MLATQLLPSAWISLCPLYKEVKPKSEPARAGFSEKTVSHLGSGNALTLGVFTGKAFRAEAYSETASR